MNDRVGIWIDHKKAVIVFASTHGVTSKTVESEVGSHSRFSGPLEGGGEKKYEDRFGEHLDQYYDHEIGRASCRERG